MTDIRGQIAMDFRHEPAHTRRDDPLSSFIAAEKVNVTKDELLVLRLVRNYPGRSARFLNGLAGQICDGRTDKPSKRMSGLETKELVTRTAIGDSKELHCQITGKGKKLLKKG